MKLFFSKNGRTIIAVVVAFLIPVIMIFGVVIFANQKQAHATTQVDR